MHNGTRLSKSAAGFGNKPICGLRPNDKERIVGQLDGSEGQDKADRSLVARAPRCIVAGGACGACGDSCAAATAPRCRSSAAAWLASTRLWCWAKPESQKAYGPGSWVSLLGGQPGTGAVDLRTDRREGLAAHCRPQTKAVHGACRSTKRAFAASSQKRHMGPRLPPLPSERVWGGDNTILIGTQACSTQNNGLTESVVYLC